MMLSLSTSITHSIPQGLLCILFVVVCVLLSQAALTGFNACAKKLEYSNDVAGIVFGGISLIYSLVLAFVIVAVWDDYTDLEKTIDAEGDKLNNIISYTNSLPDSIRANVSEVVYTYCNDVINNEWQMTKEKTIEKSNTISGLRQQLLNTEAKNKIQENILAVVDRDLGTLSDLRRERLNHNHSQIPDMVWFTLNVGGAMLVIFFFFFSVPTLKLKRIYLSFIVSCIAMCMFLVYTLDHPFKNSHGISSQLYQDIRSELKGLNTLPPD